MSPCPHNYRDSDKAVFLIHFIGLMGTHFLKTVLKTVLTTSNIPCFAAMPLFLVRAYAIGKRNNINIPRKSCWFLHDFPQYVHSLQQLGEHCLIIKEKALAVNDEKKNCFREFNLMKSEVVLKPTKLPVPLKEGTSEVGQNVF